MGKTKKFRLSPHSEPRNRARAFLINKRNQMGITQRKLAELLFVHRSLVSKIETGKRELDTHEMLKFASVLNFTSIEYYEFIANGFNE